jgi:hypothetical protein
MDRVDQESDDDETVSVSAAEMRRLLERYSPDDVDDLVEADLSPVDEPESFSLDAPPLDAVPLLAAPALTTPSPARGSFAVVSLAGLAFGLVALGWFVA